MVQYLIRLDDLCPTNNIQKWERFFDLLDQYNIKPIVAVIPDNHDLQLKACGTENADYWDVVRKLQAKDYVIGMHGFEHLYQTSNPGLLKFNKRSEFAGLPLHIQQKKIGAAAAIFKRENVKTPVFVAPAHSFDRNTILALANCSEVTTVSDGYLSRPYLKWGFKWIPVQLPEATSKSRGTWTFNYHPETCTDKVFDDLKKFVDKHHHDFVSLADLNYSIYTGRDHLIDLFKIYGRILYRYAKKCRAALKHDNIKLKAH